MERAFENNLLLEKIVVSELIEEIDKYAFAGCTSLKSVTIGADVEVIKVYALQNCENLESAVFKTSSGWRANEKFLDNLADDKKAAEYLRDVYVKYLWSR